MIGTRNLLLREVAKRYSQARERYESAREFGDTDRADEALSSMQLIEDCIAVRELSREWRG